MLRRIDRRWLLAGAVPLVWALVELGRILSAPGVPETCSTVLELAAQAGETTDEADRSACEARYRELRASRGPVGWARLARCVRGAKTIPEAGGC